MDNQAEKLKVDNLEYYTPSYLGESFRRLYSYIEQVKAALAINPSSLLLIGKGDGIVVGILKKYCPRVDTLDVEDELKPDIVGSVLNIPCRNKKYDVIVCCQVLEHLDFTDVQGAIEEMRRVSRQRIVISVPDKRRCVTLRMKIPIIELSWQVSIPRLFKPKQNHERVSLNEHAWEIGYKGAGYRKLAEMIFKANVEIVNSYRVYDYRWHTFIICKVHA